MGVDLPTIWDWSEQSVRLERQGAYSRDSVVVERGGEAQRVPAAVASEGFFATLGVRPARGRLFAPADDVVGAPPAVVLSDGAWERLTGRDPAVLGSTLVLDGAVSEVVGVLPPEFRFGAPVDVWRSFGSFLQNLPAELDTCFTLKRCKARNSKRRQNSQQGDNHHEFDQRES
jgi:hypothetical protein